MEQKPKTAAELLEETRLELEKKALLKRVYAGGDPIKTLKSEEDLERERDLQGPHHRGIGEATAKSPDEVIEEEGLGRSN